MDSELSKALLLLFVGMFTVVVILSLVVLSGKALILIINRFFPMPPEPVKKERQTINNQIQNSIDPKKLAAIVAAVEVVTGGRGKISKVEKIS